VDLRTAAIGSKRLIDTRISAEPYKILKGCPELARKVMMLEGGIIFK